MNMSEKTVNGLVAAWFAGEYTMFDACSEEPETAWLAILEISRRDLTEEQKGLLASGPIETLLAWHGPSFIDRLEREARANVSFGNLLGGVWRRDMAGEIWERVQRARGES
jgi:hypothetical protein